MQIKIIHNRYHFPPLVLQGIQFNLFFGANNNSNHAMVVRIHIGAIWFVFKSSPINMFYKYVLMKVNFVGLKAKVAKTKEEVG